MGHGNGVNKQRY